jgi:hypothetical protein
VSLFESGARKTSRTFTAKYVGTCATCSDGFDVGDEVVFDDDELIHVECIEVPTGQTSMKVCQKCFLAHAGDCF